MRLILLAPLLSSIAAQCGMPNQLYPDLCQPTVVTQVLTPTENETIEVYVTAYNQFNQTFVIPLSVTVSGNSTPIINVYTSITVPTDSTLIVLTSMLLVAVLVYILKDTCSSHRCRWLVKPATLPEPDLRAVAV
jgi:hypothetical protein